LSLTMRLRGMKKLVPPTRSRVSRTQPPNKTANDSRARTAVISQAQQVKGIRISDMPRARRSSVVEMKFSAPRSDPTQNRAIDITQSVWPRPSPGPAADPTALRGGYAVQPARGGPSLTKKVDISTRNPANVTQNDSMFNRGNAMSSAPI